MRGSAIFGDYVERACGQVHLMFDPAPRKYSFEPSSSDSDISEVGRLAAAFDLRLADEPRTLPRYSHIK